MDNLAAFKYFPLKHNNFPNTFNEELEKCRSGTYGLNCTDKCGNCKVNTGCNQISGACEEDCKDGWLFPTCMECPSWKTWVMKCIFI
ncbi:hypothetical protein KUTeg_015844 [Tegillarca granosa]|uniref:Uncharacterized protein n=1 Tax=Tegillarca granosa TaxID=220873 RepID=A0ABQ9EJ35_TEGGR|nr:hypothetical protein KUTeg_015844 [Tegillarca granosa]